MNKKYLIGFALLAQFWATVAIAGCFPIPVPPFFACVLDREGTGSTTPPDYYTCHENFDLVKASGNPYFKIELKGFCGIHPGGGLPGWTPVPWKSVTILADFNYDSGITNETVWDGNKVMLKAGLKCSSNPWAHTPGCTKEKDLTNNTGVQYNGPLPVSAWRISHELRQTLAKWENTTATDDSLEKWDPYAGSSYSGMSIASPTDLEVIPANAANFLLAVDLGSETSTPQNLQIQWQKIIPAPAVVGDLALPDSATHWWEPFFGPTATQWTSLPLAVAVNPGYFDSKPGLYEIQVRNAAGGAWSSPRRFWIGNPSFDPPPAPQMQSDKKFAVAGKDKIKAIRMVEGQKRVRLLAKDKAKSRAILNVTRVTWDEGAARPGRPVSLTVTVKNTGNAPSSAGSNKLHIMCAPATDCPRANVVNISAVIKPGKSYTLTVPNAVQPKYGHTRFYVSTKPVTLIRGLNLKVTR
jgi:hypothetical protein